MALSSYTWCGSPRQQFKPNQVQCPLILHILLLLFLNNISFPPMLLCSNQGGTTQQHFASWEKPEHQWTRWQHDRVWRLQNVSIASQIMGYFWVLRWIFHIIKLWDGAFCRVASRGEAPKLRWGMWWKPIQWHFSIECKMWLLNTCIKYYQHNMQKIFFNRYAGSNKVHSLTYAEL